jgi:16S rRNA A1518/A1519 N6-dimethyltransferase RsmA/KsgA/DIM1 with predicted DNA glycosylase/AP lyase activity
MFKNNLSFLQSDADAINAAFSRSKVNPQARAEDLSLEQFASLTDVLAEIDMRKRSHD